MENNFDFLTDRDKKLLHLLGKCGVLRTDQAKLIYDGVRKYHLRRIEKLASKGMIVREHGYIRPTSRGLQAAGFEGRPIRVKKHQYKDRVLAVDVLSNFQDWEIEYAIELKRREVVERRSQISAVISKGSLQYGVYIQAHTPRPSTVCFLQSEMRELHMAGIERVIIFYLTSDYTEVFDKAPDYIKECCLLPYPAGVNSFKRIFSQDFRAFINQRFPGLKPCRRPFAHFQWQGKYITVMHNNDLVKRQALIDYLTYAQKRESRPCIIVCAPSQAQEISNLFQEYEMELIIDEGTDTEIQKPSATQKENNFRSLAHYPIHF
mgnify:CR=1 FL=1